MAVHYVFPFDKVLKNSRIIIWGAGTVGIQYIKQLCSTHYYESLYVVDKSEKSKCDTFSVGRPDSIINKEFDYIVIAQSRIEVVDEIRMQLDGWNISSNRVIHELYAYNDEDLDFVSLSNKFDFLSRKIDAIGKNLHENINAKALCGLDSNNKCAQRIIECHNNQTHNLMVKANNNEAMLQMLIVKDGIYNKSLQDYKYVSTIRELLEKRERLMKWIPLLENISDEKIYELSEMVFRKKRSVVFALVSCVADKIDNTIALSDGVVIEYDNLFDFSIIVEEILLNEDYYFKSGSSTPVIIDAGANIGLATYYFKSLYPECKIMAFEPNPKVFNILTRNIKRNKWRDIILHECALNDRNGSELTFYISSSGLSGSVGEGNSGGDDYTYREISVKSAKLSEFLPEHTDYLKMDIEGCETMVIRDISSKLSSIEYMFIEFHEGRMKLNNSNSISEIITYLEDNGFTVNIAKSYATENNTHYRPMEYIADNVSEVIWAKNNLNQLN